MAKEHRKPGRVARIYEPWAGYVQDYQAQMQEEHPALNYTWNEAVMSLLIDALVAKGVAPGPTPTGTRRPAKKGAK
jgi:hypothetical protein